MDEKKLEGLFYRGLVKLESNRSSDVFEVHVTDLVYDVCWREIMYGYLLGKKDWRNKKERYSNARFMAFWTGIYLEKMLSEIFNRGEVEYLSDTGLRLKLKDVYIVGKPDFLVKDGGSYYVVECKSMGLERYKVLLSGGELEEVRQYRKQVGFYLELGRLFNEMGRDRDKKIFCDYGFIMFLPKGYIEPPVYVMQVNYDNEVRNYLNAFLKFMRNVLQMKERGIEVNSTAIPKRKYCLLNKDCKYKGYCLEREVKLERNL